MNSTLILQIGVVLVAARIVGRVFRAFGQPQVIGEMVAGILLGPSLLGWVAPSLSAALFPASTIPLLADVSQLGLVLFLFAVGLEHDPTSLRDRAWSVVLVSHTSIAVPLSLGVVLALLLYPRLSDDSVSFTVFALFLGSAMSITAFPVLARIVVERDLLGTPVGALALVCAAVNDVTGWLIIAGVLLLTQDRDASLPWLAALGVGGYVTLMLTAGRRLFRRLLAPFRARGDVTPNGFALVLAIAFASAWVTELLGVHPLFGAFIAGVAMPKEPELVHALIQRIWDLTVVLLLPLFFVVSGLRTRIDLIGDAERWLELAIILIVAVVGKLGGAAIAGRTTGLSWRESTAIGVLVNTRGLIELVLLNIGLEAGVISPALFTMMVLMAITTTFMTTPLLDWIYPARLRQPLR